jgi:hypothetical protein
MQLAAHIFLLSIKTWCWIYLFVCDGMMVAATAATSRAQQRSINQSIHARNWRYRSPRD